VGTTKIVDDDDGDDGDDGESITNCDQRISPGPSMQDIQS